MKKRWVLLLLLATALFISCSEAQASVMDGTWKIYSGSLFEEDRGGRWVGYLSDVDPSEFSIRVVERVKELYSMVLNNGDDIGLFWTFTEYPSGEHDSSTGSIRDMDYLVKISETEYRSNFTEDGITYERSIVLLDSYTLKLTRMEYDDTDYRRYEYTLERTGWDPFIDPDESGGGCNAMAANVWVSAWAVVFLAIQTVRRKDRQVRE